MKNLKIQKIFSKASAIMLGVLIASNVAVMGVHAAFPENNYVLSEITGDGIALRSAPSTSSTRLGLMYRGEVVGMNNDYRDINGWAQIKRFEPSDVGFCASMYVKELD